MSETKMVEVEKVQQDKVVTIEISGFFYQRFHKFIMDYMSAKGPDEYLKTLQKLAEEYQVKVPEDDDSINLETLIILIRTMEDAFSKAGYVDKSEVEVTITPKTPN